MDKLQGSNQSDSKKPSFSLGRSNPDYTEDSFFASIEQHLESVAPSGSYKQLNDSPPCVRRRTNVKSTCTIEERHARALEKNRAAQKRFRDKQKVKLNQMEQQVEELSNKVQQLELEKQELQEQLRVSKDNTSSDGTQSHHTEAIDQAAETEELKKVEGVYYMKSIDREMTSEMIRNLHIPEVQDYVMETMMMMINEITLRVQEADVLFPDRAKMAKLEEVVEDERACMVRMFVINPAGAQAMGCHKYLDPLQQSESEAAFELQVQTAVEKMQLSETQKSVISFLWKRYCELQTDCMQKRTEIAKQLTEADASKKHQWAYYKQFTETHKLVFRVRENWRQDYKNHWDLMSCISLQILTPLQFGRMIYYMAPKVMDFFIFCRVIAKQTDANNNNNENNNISQQQQQQLYNNSNQQHEQIFYSCQNNSDKDSPADNLFVFGQGDNFDVQDLLKDSSIDIGEIDDLNQFDSGVSQQIAPNSPGWFQDSNNSNNNFQL